MLGTMKLRYIATNAVFCPQSIVAYPPFSVLIFSKFFVRSPHPPTSSHGTANPASLPILTAIIFLYQTRSRCVALILEHRRLRVEPNNAMYVDGRCMGRKNKEDGQVVSWHHRFSFLTFPGSRLLGSPLIASPLVLHSRKSQKKIKDKDEKSLKGTTRRTGRCPRGKSEKVPRKGRE